MGAARWAADWGPKGRGCMGAPRRCHNLPACLPALRRADGTPALRAGNLGPPVDPRVTTKVRRAGFQLAECVCVRACV